MRNFLALILALTLLPAAAEVYRWKDDKGVFHYTDKPPTKDAKPVELPALQTYSPSATAPPAAALPEGPAASDPAASSTPAISIASPAADETIRDAEGRISVSLNANPKPGQGLLYFLDGRQQNAVATPSTAWLLESVERGEHTLTAALVGADGRELARSAPVTVFMMPPIAR